MVARFGSVADFGKETTLWASFGLQVALGPPYVESLAKVWQPGVKDSGFC